MLERLKALIGEFPAPAPLAPVLLESVDMGVFTRNKLEYTVEQGERVRAFLLVPNDFDGKRPAVFCHHQHAGDFSLGKSEVVGLSGHPDQAYAKELAELGYVTFAPDAIGFEERSGDGDPWQNNYFQLAARLVQGRTLTAKVLHDVMVGIDLMVSRPEIDPDRLGFIGHSYGGRMALWAPLFDRRIEATVSSCGCSSYADGLNADSGIQMEFCVPGIQGWGDMPDFVKLIEPASALIVAARDDKWSRGATEIFEAARSAFVNGELSLELFEGGHAFPHQARKQAYAFLDRHLRPRTAKSG